MVDENPRAIALGKRLAPKLTLVAQRVIGLEAVEKLAAYLQLLAGQGAGTGWDEGELIVAAKMLTDQELPTVVDCGANYGQWTQGLRARVGSGGRWLLIEPTSELVPDLRELPNVEVLEAAAGEINETRDFHVPTEPSGWMTLHARGDTFSQSKNFRTRTVDVVRLDEQLEQRNIESVDYMKIDVEGHELFVLRGLGRYLTERRIRAFSFEFGAGNVNSRTYFRDFWELLHPNGYELFRIAPGGIRVPVHAYYETLEFFRGATNYIAVAAA